MGRHTERETIARAIIVENGRLLVNSSTSKQTNGSYCALPGGHVDVLESCQAALRREFREELAADLTVHDLLFVSESIYEGRRRSDGVRHELALYFQAELASPLGQEDGRIMSPEFDKNFIWLPLEEMAQANLLPVVLREFLQANLIKGEIAVSAGPRYGFHDFSV
jgi:ADP-ribose pyrophosphatase YjhB (NUDIX family)